MSMPSTKILEDVLCEELAKRGHTVDDFMTSGESAMIVYAAAQRTGLTIERCMEALANLQKT